MCHFINVINITIIVWSLFIPSSHHITFRYIQDFDCFNQIANIGESATK